MQNYVKVINLLKENNTNWLAHRSVIHVEAFLTGFFIPDFLKERLHCITKLINEFNAYLRAKFPQSMRSLYLEGYSDEESLNLYFKEWDTFTLKWFKENEIKNFPETKCRDVNFEPTIAHVARRPEMYFETPSVELLYSLLSGARRAQEFYAPNASVFPDLDLFESWLCEKNEIRKCRWDRLLLAQSHFNTQIAFNDFFKNLHQWKQDLGLI